MNIKLLASIAVFVLLTAVISIPMTNSAFAAEPKKDDAKAKADKKAADAKAKADKKETKTTTSKTSSATPVKEISVDMAKGTASNQNCADQCYMPSTVNVSVGGKVTWKNVDSAAHTATATDSSFDTSLVNAGASASNTFNTAGTYPYMCILHPWMKGTVNVQ